MSPGDREAPPPGGVSVLVPELVRVGDRFQAGLAVECDGGSGLIRRVRPATGQEEPGVVRLPGVALIPGFVNAHSHAFQRLIRGRTQWRPADDESADFWSWRAAMYAAALELTPEEVEVVARQCFLEMLLAGWTTVGEFHYLHNDPAGRPYANRSELAERVLSAARDVGIRIALLDVCYAAGGIGRPLEHAQRRFGTTSLDAFLTGVGDLADRHAEDPLVSVGVAPHSVRAVPRDWLRPLADWARDRGAVCHMHVSEQPAEVEAAVAEWGLRPVEALAEEDVLSPSFTAVHATHLVAGEVGLLAGSGATVCACPTTERDLGDGFLPGLELLEAGVPVALGSDSQTRIDPFEEMRLVEYHERLRRRRRVVLGRRDEHRLDAGSLLLDMAASSGARALGTGAAAIARGQPADLIGVDLHHPDIAGVPTDGLASALALCAGPGVVRHCWVAGKRRVADGRHALQETALRAFEDVARARTGSPPS